MSDSAILWTVALQAPLPMGFSKQEYWSGLPFPSPRDLSNPGIEPGSLTSPWQAGSLLLVPPGKLSQIYLAHFYHLFFFSFLSYLHFLKVSTNVLLAKSVQLSFFSVLQGFTTSFTYYTLPSDNSILLHVQQYKHFFDSVLSFSFLLFCAVTVHFTGMDAINWGPPWWLSGNEPSC